MFREVLVLGFTLLMARRDLPFVGSARLTAAGNVQALFILSTMAERVVTQ